MTATQEKTRADFAEQKPQLVWSSVPYYTHPVILTEGGHVDGCGKTVGVFDSEEAARSNDPDQAAIGSLGWGALTDEQRQTARRNSESLCDKQWKDELIAKAIDAVAADDAAGHTPGPWAYQWLSQADAPRRFDDEPEVWPIVVHAARGSNAGAIVCEIHHDQACDPADKPSTEAFANARLIAAAPTMEDALAKILVLVAQGVDQRDLEEIERLAAAALSHAWGRQE